MITWIEVHFFMIEVFIVSNVVLGLLLVGILSFEFFKFAKIIFDAPTVTHHLNTVASYMHLKQNID